MSLGMCGDGIMLTCLALSHLLLCFLILDFVHHIALLLVDEGYSQVSLS